MQPQLGCFAEACCPPATAAVPEMYIRVPTRLSHQLSTSGMLERAGCRPKAGTCKQPEDWAEVHTEHNCC